MRKQLVRNSSRLVDHHLLVSNRTRSSSFVDRQLQVSFEEHELDCFGLEM